jgi:sugar phosphate isomerase/epimerase
MKEASPEAASVWSHGLVSITFRDLPAMEVIRLAARAGLRSIEWGGDVHVPHGDIGKAIETRRAAEDAGLEVAAYGSYWRAVEGPAPNPDFAAVVETAANLGAPTIRVWPGQKASADADDGYRAKVNESLQRACDQAQASDVRVALEFHGGTLTDTAESARRLLADVPHPNLDTLWQPPNGQPVEVCEAGLRAVLHRVSNVHVFHWWPTARERLPLDEGRDRWHRYLAVLRTSPRPRHLLLEFVAGNDPEQLLRDAATLREFDPFRG